MKKLILLILASAPAILFAQEKYTIKGNVGKLDAPAKIYLDYSIGLNEIRDSATVTNGAFTFKGEVKDITSAVVIVDYNGTGLENLVKGKGKVESVSVWLENGTILITSPDSMRNAKVSGTKLNDDYQHFADYIKPATDAKNALNKEYHATSQEKKDTKEFKDYLRKRDSVINVQRSNLIKQYIAANPDSHMSLQMIDYVDDSYPDVNINLLQSTFNKLSPEIRATAEGIAYQKKLNAVKAVMVGATAPEFAEPDTNGKMVSLSSFRGKYVLLDFWASWCGPCRAENPKVVKTYNNFKGKNFTILSVSLDDPKTKNAWLKAIHDDHLNWNHVSDLKGWENDAVLLYGISGIPQNLLIDPNGKIIAKGLLSDDLEKKLAEVLK